MLSATACCRGSAIARARAAARGVSALRRAFPRRSAGFRTLGTRCAVRRRLGAFAALRAGRGFRSFRAAGALLAKVALFRAAALLAKVALFRAAALLGEITAPGIR